MLLSRFFILESTKMALPNTVDLITIVCRLVYLITLLITLPLNKKLSEKERLMF